MNKKSATSISILLLVFMALILSGTALFVFYTSTKPEKLILDSRIVENAYIKEEQVNFLISQGISLQDAVNMLGLEIINGKIQTKIISDDGKIIVLYEFEAGKSSVENIAILQNNAEDAAISQDEKEIDEKNLAVGEQVNFQISGESHSLTLINIFENRVAVEISSQPITITISVGESVKLDLDNDRYYDLKITLVSIYSETSFANIKKEIIHEEIRAPVSSYIEEAYGNNQKAMQEYKKNFENYYKTYYSNEEKTEKLQAVEQSKKPEEKNWIDSLPWRPETKYVDYGVYNVPCGPSALHEAFRELGKEVNLNDLIKLREGGFRRGFLSIFSSQAKGITWPSEMEKIAKLYGFDVERISGKEVNLDTMIKKSTPNSVVIARMGPFFDQHYAVFDTNLIKRNPGKNGYWNDFTIADPNKDVRELYVIKK